MNQKDTLVPMEISARHIHLSQEDRGALFGKEHKLKPIKDLSQKGEFAAEEKVDIEYNEEEIKGIRVVGPEREKTQLELTFADAHKLKADIPVRLSGDVDKTPGFRIIGPSGVVIKKEGMIIAKRHLHVGPKDAEKYGLKNDKLVSVVCGSDGDREVTFHKIPVRIKENFRLAVHIDVDEANAAGLKICSVGKLFLK